MKRVLIVEDNRDIRIILKKRLEDCGFTVDSIENGLSFIGYLKTEQEPDIVILDLILPERSGIELIGGLISKWHKTKVFIFSAHEEYKERIKGYVCGFCLKTEGIDKLIREIKKFTGEE